MKLIPTLMAAVALLAPFAVAAQDTTRDVVVDSITGEQVGFLPMHVGGKVQQNSQGYSYQWPAVYFEANFTGQGVTMLFDDSANNFNVIIDGQNKMVLRKPGQASISVGVPKGGPHTIRVEKRSETQYATGHFIGFIAQGGTPFTPRARQIEFIGDSLTVGYGNTSAFTQCTPDEIFETTDSQEGFGPLVAKHFDADYQVNAFSGLGMVRNYDGREHAKYHMPMLYPRAIFDDPAPAVQPEWHPQIIVIGIGGNDFSTPVHEGEPWKTADELQADYVKTYTAFVKTIRAANPAAFILLATPQDREDGYQQGTDAVFANMKAAGDGKIDRVTLPALQSTGCNGHPNIHSDADVANMYIGYIEAHPALWQGK